MMMLESLQRCKLINQVTHEETLKRLFSLPVSKSMRISSYLGIDPTAPSLHVGHLLGLHVLKQMPTRKIVLMGGATALIGDPSGRTEERKHLVSEDQVRDNTEGISRQVAKFFEDQKEEVKIVNNIDWTANLSTVTFLRDVGKHFRLLEMLKRDAVMMNRNNLDANNNNEGISFTELSYQVLQGYDFLHLYRTENCRIQIGGSDQWGNIVGGVDLIKRAAAGNAKNNNKDDDDDIHPIGVTFPLVTVGKEKQKLGKSSGNAVWLDPKLTSDFDFYQYFLRLDDEDAAKMCIMFGVVDVVGSYSSSSSSFSTATMTRTTPRRQSSLAREMTQRVRGTRAVTNAETLTEALYGGHQQLLSDAEGGAIKLREAIREAGMPVTMIPRSSKKGLSSAELAVMCGLAASNGEARRLQVSATGGVGDSLPQS